MQKSKIRFKRHFLLHSGLLFSTSAINILSLSMRDNFVNLGVSVFSKLWKSRVKKNFCLLKQTFFKGKQLHVQIFSSRFLQFYYYYYFRNSLESFFFPNLILLANSKFSVFFFRVKNPGFFFCTHANLALFFTVWSTRCFYSCFVDSNNKRRFLHKNKEEKQGNFISLKNRNVIKNEDKQFVQSTLSVKNKNLLTSNTVVNSFHNEDDKSKKATEKNKHKFRQKHNFSRYKETPDNSYKSSNKDDSLFSFLSISNSLKKKLSDLRIKKLTEIQLGVIPLILNGEDVIGISPCGTGKSYSYIIPMIEKIEAEKLKNNNNVLIVLPTRELVEQVAIEIYKLRSSNLSCSVCTAVGGLKDINSRRHKAYDNVFDAQKEAIKRGVHVVVGTPGKLKRLIEDKILNFYFLKMLVLDEIDQLLSTQFYSDLVFIFTEIHKQSSCRIFSVNDMLHSSPSYVPQSVSAASVQCIGLTAFLSKWMEEQVLNFFLKKNEPHNLKKKIKLVNLSKNLGEIKNINHAFCRVSKNNNEKIKNILYLIESFYQGKFNNVCQVVSKHEDRVNENQNKNNKLYDFDKAKAVENEKLLSPEKSEYENKSREIVKNENEHFQKVIVFCNTRNDCILIASHPWMLIRSRTLHAEMSQLSRNQTILDFKKGKFSILIASDLAARGLDIQNVGLIIHFAPSLTSELYIHRCGRAGRNLDAAQSIVLYDFSQERLLRRIEKDTKYNFTELDLPAAKVMRERFLAKIEADIVNPAGIDYEVFEDHATVELSKHGIKLIAASLILLEEAYRSTCFRSVLSGKLNFVVLLFHDPFSQIIKSRLQLISIIQKCFELKSKKNSIDVLSCQKQNSQTSNCRIGRIALTKRGYIVDMLAEDAAYLLKSEVLRENSLHVSYVSEIPSIVYDELRVRQHRWRQKKYLLSESNVLNKLNKRSLSKCAKRKLSKQLAKIKEKTLFASLQKNQSTIFSKFLKST